MVVRRLALALPALLVGCYDTSGAPTHAAHSTTDASALGLSLFFTDGEPDVPVLELPSAADRYLAEIDLVATVDTDTDEGIEPVTTRGDFAGLDWEGVEFVEEDWRQGFDGTWIRQRFYRGAAWMEKPSVFRVIPRDEAGEAAGEPLLARAGADDRQTRADDAFVRRFVARQYVAGCQARGDCSNVSSYRAQALAQLRVPLGGEERARTIPADTAQLALRWTADPQSERVVPVSRDEGAYGPGFAAQLEELSTPSQGGHYAPGDTVTFRVAFRDGEGRRLHPEGSLPTYAEFVRGEVESGLRYYDGFRLQPTMYYALKQREAIMSVGLAGPTDAIEVPQEVVSADQLFLPQTTTATPEGDGFTGLAAFIPPGPVLFGGAQDPAVWETPVSDEVSFEIPPDAQPGTYVASLKARRDYGGEALHRGATAEIQIGTDVPTEFARKTGNCRSCHTGDTGLSRIGHGFTDRRVCATCHAPLSFEPDNGLDIRVHSVHDRSDRFPGDVRDCGTCHLEPPDGPARGLLE